jgi:hypothetical protein
MGSDPGVFLIINDRVQVPVILSNQKSKRGLTPIFSKYNVSVELTS